MADVDKIKISDVDDPEFAGDRREDRAAGGGAWMVGLVLIGIGVLYMLQETGITPGLTNWWALFILIPAAATLSSALGVYRRNGGEFNGEVIGPLLAGVFFVGLTAVFLFSLDTGWLWPLFLIGGGLLLLAGPWLSRRRA